MKLNYKLSFINFFIVACLLGSIHVYGQTYTIKTVAGNGNQVYVTDGVQATATPTGARGVAVDDSGNIYIADRTNSRIRKVTPDGIIHTIAGTGAVGHSGDGGPAINATMNAPAAIFVDHNRNIYFSDGGNYVRKVSASGIITAVAGNGSGSSTGDGSLAIQASVNIPTGIVVDKAGNIYIGENYGNRVRKVNTSGIISTFAGGKGGFSGDGGPATAAGLTVWGLGIDDTDNIYIADTYNNRVRKVNASGIITTVAGTGAQVSGGDGGLATAASFYYPAAIAFDKLGNMYIDETEGMRVRKVTTDGIISTIAGSGYFNGGQGGFYGDGGPATSAQFGAPLGIAVDTFGNVYIPDDLNFRVRECVPQACLVPVIPDSITGPTVICDELFHTYSIPAVAGALAYTWTIPNGWTSSYNPSLNPPQIKAAAANSPSSSGYITVTAINQCGKSLITKLFIQVGSNFNAMALPADTAICLGGGVHLTVSGITGYSWSPATGLSCTNCQNPVANPLATTTYVVTGLSGTCTSTDSVVVKIAPAFTISTIPADTTVCSGNSVSLSSSGADIYTWMSATGLGATTGSTILASPVVTTTYMVTGSKGGCTNSAQVIVNMAPIAVSGTISAVRDTVCQGTTASLSLAGNSSNIIQWQSSVNDSAFLSNGPIDTVQYRTNPLGQTTFYRVVVGNGNCSATSGVLTVYVPPALTAAFKSVQAGLKITFNSDSSLGNITSYFWDFGDGATSTDANPVHTFNSDTIYNVCLTIYDGSNCSYTFCRAVNVSANGVNAVEAIAGLNVYPNPVADEIYLSTKNANGKLQQVQFVDVLGRIALNKNIGSNQSQSLLLNVSTLTRGVYFLKVRMDNIDYVQKVTKL